MKELEFGYAVDTETIERKPYWDTLNVSIYKDGNKVGEYKRNYPNLFNTFVPFKQGDKEYALYSKEYTATRVMSLPDCVDLGGEEVASNGFCPTDFYVPRIEILHVVPKDERVEGQDPYWEEVRYGQFAFVAGCVWGDDTSYKIQYLDLSRVSEGIIVREEKFGYLELPSFMDLKDAIHFRGYQDTFPYVEIATGINFRMDTGEAMDVGFKMEK